MGCDKHGVEYKLNSNSTFFLAGTFHMATLFLFQMTQRPCWPDDGGTTNMASSSRSKEKLTDARPSEDDLEIIENGGLSPQPSIKTDDDANSEIVRIEERADEEEKYHNSTFGRFVRTLQVGLEFSRCIY